MAEKKQNIPASNIPFIDQYNKHIAVPWYLYLKRLGDRKGGGEVGPQGPQGPAGPQGEKGEQGDPGSGLSYKGQVPTYADLPSTAEDGDAYQVLSDGLFYIWGEGGFPPEGNGAQLQGPKGDKGDKGDAGDTGPQGPQGEVGPKGDTGDTGPQGLQGETGPEGPQGPKGDAGEQGPQGEQGPKGDKGDKGDTGPEGPVGPQGAEGPVGPRGPQGEQGPQGEKGEDGAMRFPLLSFMWSDHVIDDMPWLRADAFSWQSGDVYVAAYEHLVADTENPVKHDVQLYAWGDSLSPVYTTSETPVEGDIVYRRYSIGSENIDAVSAIIGVTGSTITTADGLSANRLASADTVGAIAERTDTIDNITITYCLAQDGHKICLPDQESNLVALYEATGVAWYYILDTTNQRFKLPRSKHNKYADTVPVVGNGEASTYILPNNAEGKLHNWSNNYSYNNAAGFDAGSSAGGGDAKLTTDPEKSGLIAQQAQDTDQYKYLYFYVGNFEQSATEQTAGLNTELFNGKADRNLLNTTDNVDIVVESQLPTSANGYTWYRKYKSGWVEQGGILTQSGDSSFITTITFPIVMTDNNYNVSFAGRGSNTRGGDFAGAQYTNESTTGMEVYVGNANTTYTKLCWQVSGMSAQ